MATFTCEVCGATIIDRPSHARRFCSFRCKGLGKSADTAKAWRSPTGETLGEFLHRRYTVELASYRDLMRDFGSTQARMVRRMLERHGIPIRRGGEAVATQWIDAEDRRRASSVMFERHCSERGTYSHGARRSKWEIKVGDALSDAGLHVEPQREFRFRARTTSRRCREYERTGHYLVDLYLPEVRVGVEVFGSASNLNPFRHRFFEQLGVRMVYVPNLIAKRDGRRRIDELVSALQRMRLDPSAPADEELVRWGYPEGATVGRRYLEKLRSRAVYVPLDDAPPAGAVG